MPSADTVTLLADIGGTHARFALLQGGQILHVEGGRAADHASAADAAKAYLARHNAQPRRAALSIAASVMPGQDAVELVNHPAWNFSQAAFRAALGLDHLLLINDFEALAHAVPHLRPQDLRQIGTGAPERFAPIGVIGPGTGLGVAGIVFHNGQPQAVASEGGNTTLPATTLREFQLLDEIRALTGHTHVSAEEAVSGLGLVNLYQAIGRLDGRDLPARDGAAITAAAINGRCTAAAESVDLFCHFLGVVAGNLALTLGAFGGIYITGGIIPQWGEHFAASRFRQSFAAKGVYSDYVARIPTWLVLHPYPAFEGLKRLTERA